jgi:hypothetical protein
MMPYKLEYEHDVLRELCQVSSAKVCIYFDTKEALQNYVEELQRELQSLGRTDVVIKALDAE